MVEEAEDHGPRHRRSQQPRPRPPEPGPQQDRGDDRRSVDHDRDVRKLPGGEGHDVLPRVGGRVRGVDRRRNPDHCRPPKGFASAHRVNLQVGVVFLKFALTHKTEQWTTRDTAPRQSSDVRCEIFPSTRITTNGHPSPRPTSALFLSSVAYQVNGPYRSKPPTYASR